MSLVFDLAYRNFSYGVGSLYFSKISFIVGEAGIVEVLEQVFMDDYWRAGFFIVSRPASFYGLCFFEDVSRMECS